MMSDILNEINTGKFLIIVMSEDEYVHKLREIIEHVNEEKSKICYVCLSKPYNYVIESLEASGIDIKNFYFLDTMTSHYESMENTEKCEFLKSPLNLDDLGKAIAEAIVTKNCNTVLFDTISTLLIYNDSSSVIKFTHKMTCEKQHEHIKKLFIVLKEDVSTSNETGFVNDLEMFADKKIEIYSK